MARLLLIDDDPELLDVLAEVLAEAGHEVEKATNGGAGIEAAHRSPPDLVLCDVEMPGMDGYAVLEAFRADARFAVTPFLFLTGLSAGHHARAAMSLGADDYLTKPVSNRDLIEAVGARLARRAASRREADRRVDEIQRSVALLLPHELRTPLTIILGGSETLRELRHELAPEEIGEMATAIVKAGERLNRMVENYLLQVGLELNRLTKSESLTSALLGDADAEHVDKATRERARQHGRDGDVTLDLADVTLPIASPYAAKIASELVDNALKFSKVGKPVRVSLWARGGRVCLEVVDEGRGMTADELTQLGAFRQFGRALFEQQGSGLGLALVKGIVEASHGTLDLVSTPGSGTTARASWPQRGLA